MSGVRIAVSLDTELLARLDRLVKGRVFASRSQAVQVAVQEKMNRLAHDRLARECAKVDRRAERAMAEEGIEEDMKKWPEW